MVGAPHFSQKEGDGVFEIDAGALSEFTTLVIFCPQFEQNRSLESTRLPHLGQKTGVVSFNISVPVLKRCAVDCPHPEQKACPFLMGVPHFSQKRGEVALGTVFSFGISFWKTCSA